jgi:hypothetical protein
MWYVENLHGTAGMGQSYGYATVIECSEPPRGDMTRSYSGPFATEAEAEAQAAADNAVHDAYADEANGLAEGTEDPLAAAAEGLGRIVTRSLLRQLGE